MSFFITVNYSDEKLLSLSVSSPSSSISSKHGLPLLYFTSKSLESKTQTENEITM